MLRTPDVTRRDLLAGSTLLALVGLVGLPAEVLAAVPPLDAEGNDPFFGESFIDKDEWRDKPVRHRYVHGGFAGTDTRFSFYFPPEPVFKGRLFQFLQGGPGGSENAMGPFGESGHNLDFIQELGGIFMESNQGHFGNDLSGLKGDPSILLYRAAAQSARHAKKMAAEMYGRHVHHAYTYGGSGGGIRSLHCLENTDVFQGGVPFIMPMGANFDYFSLLGNVVRVLGPDGMAKVNDAVEVGGSGNPYANLSELQQRELRRLYQAGFPRNMWINNPIEQVLVWTWTKPSFDEQDPTYFTDFWTKPGYAGYDRTEGIPDSIVDVVTRVERVMTGDEMVAYVPPFEVVDALGVGSARLSARQRPKLACAFIPAEAQDQTGSMGGATVTFLSGAAKGRTLYVIGVTGNALGMSALDPLLLDGVKPGDEVHIDNRDYLAWTHYHRHAVQSARETQWAFKNGQPIYPQRKRVILTFAGEYRFRNDKKMIIVQNLKDRGTWPYQAVAYRDALAKNQGPLDDQVMLWFNQHAWHGAVYPPAPGAQAPVDITRIANFGGVIQQALVDLVDWVEKGVRPPTGPTRMQVSDEQEIIVEANPVRRGGVQPGVTLSGNGRTGKVVVKAGAEVRFTALAQVPEKAGTLIKAEWDFDGAGHFPLAADGLNGTANHATLSERYTYDKPGIYYPTIRVWSHREGSVTDPNRRIANLGRIRVVVT